MREQGPVWKFVSLLYFCFITFFQYKKARILTVFWAFAHVFSSSDFYCQLNTWFVQSHWLSTVYHTIWSFSSTCSSSFCMSKATTFVGRPVKFYSDFYRRWQPTAAFHVDRRLVSEGQAARLYINRVMQHNAHSILCQGQVWNKNSVSSLVCDSNVARKYCRYTLQFNAASPTHDSNARKMLICWQMI